MLDFANQQQREGLQATRNFGTFTIKLINFAFLDPGYVFSKQRIFREKNRILTLLFVDSNQASSPPKDVFVIYDHQMRGPNKFQPRIVVELAKYL